MGQGYFWTISFITGIILIIASGFLELVVFVKENKTNSFTNVAYRITHNVFLRKTLFTLIFIWFASICFTLMANYSPNGFYVKQNKNITTYKKVQKITSDNHSVFVTVKHNMKNQTQKITSSKKIKMKFDPNIKNRVIHTEISYGPQNTKLSKAFFVSPFNHGGGIKHINYITITSHKPLDWWHKQKIKKFK